MVIVRDVQSLLEMVQPQAVSGNGRVGGPIPVLGFTAEIKTRTQDAPVVETGFPL
jgi:hypothetical protein